MKKSYTGEEVSELLLKESLARVIREAQNLKDDAYTQGYSKGYIDGHDSAKNKQNEENATELGFKAPIPVNFN